MIILYMKKVRGYLVSLAIILVVLYVLYVVYLFRGTLFGSSKQSFENIKNSVFEASTKYADASFTTSTDGQTLYVTVNYKNLLLEQILLAVT